MLIAVGVLTIVLLLYAAPQTDANQLWPPQLWWAMDKAQEIREIPCPPLGSDLRCELRMYHPLRAEEPIYYLLIWQGKTLRQADTWIGVSSPVLTIHRYWIDTTNSVIR